MIRRILLGLLALAVAAALFQWGVGIDNDAVVIASLALVITGLALVITSGDYRR